MTIIQNPPNHRQIGLKFIMYKEMCILIPKIKEYHTSFTGKE